MAEQRCDDWQTAIIERVNGEPRWAQTPPRTHVTLELLEEPGARELLGTRYEVGEACPRLPGVVHAIRVTPPTVCQYDGKQVCPPKTPECCLTPSATPHADDRNGRRGASQ